MNTERQKLGRKGELLAANFYKKMGFEIVETNYKYGRYEVDLIVQQGKDLLVFVEVKCRSNNNFGPPEVFVSESQQERLLELADYYVHLHHWGNRIRFDIISITVDNNGRFYIRHFEDAFF